jgi:hypothetical protein
VRSTQREVPLALIYNPYLKQLQGLEFKDEHYFVETPNL